MRMTLTGDEADSLAANCGECWALPGIACRTPAGKFRRPHPARITRAGRRGALGGVGRCLLGLRRKLWKK